MAFTDDACLKGDKRCINSLIHGIKQIFCSELQEPKETKLEGADFSLELFLFVTTEKERWMFFISFSPVFVSFGPPILSLDSPSASRPCKR